MSLTVEDGTGLAGADAFVSLADADTFFAAYRPEVWTGSDAVKEAAIRRATAWLSSAFYWRGSRLNGREQALAWPRSGAKDRDYEAVDSDSVPPEVVRATLHAAALELATPGLLTPEIARLAVMEKVGPITVQYATSQKPEDARTTITAVMDQIRGLIRPFRVPDAVTV